MQTLRELLDSKQITRRTIRNTIFRIREGSDNTQISTELVSELKDTIEKQFVLELNWHSFTFDWDVSATDPLKVVTQLEWDGRVDPDTKRCDPPAFTKQDM